MVFRSLPAWLAVSSLNPLHETPAIVGQWLRRLFWWHLLLNDLGIDVVPLFSQFRRGKSVDPVESQISLLPFFAVAAKAMACQEFSRFRGETERSPGDPENCVENRASKRAVHSPILHVTA